MLRRVLICILVLLLPASALASADVYHTPGSRNAPYEPVAIAMPDMIDPSADLLTVDFIDRGAADCIVLRCGGETMIVDGAAFNQYNKYIKPALQEIGVHHIDYLLNTHAHDDHIEGLIAILRDEFTVDEYMSCYPDDYNGSPEFSAVKTLLSQQNIPYRRISDGDQFTLGNAYITVYRDETPGIDKNRHSIVLKIVYGESSVLLMADAGRQTQEYFLQLYGTGAFQADVLKFAHHGMTTMSGPFLSAVSPKLVVVTNMRSSVPNTEKQLDHLHIPRYYTHAGVVRLQTDGHIWLAEQMAPDWPMNIT